VDRYGNNEFSVFTCSELRERLGIDSMSTVMQQNRLRCYGQVASKGCSQNRMDMTFC